MSALLHSGKMATDPSKKRKRDNAHAEGTKLKKKKVSIQEPSEVSKPKAATTIRVSSVTRPQFSAPVIATTPGMSVSKSVDFDCFARTGKSSSRRSKTPPSATEILLRSSAHRSIDYTAKEDKANGADASLRHYIGVFDPTTGQLQVVEAKKMTVRGTVRAREAPEEEMRSLPVRKTMADLRNDLGQTFGTKKAKKAIQSLTENAIAVRKRGEDGTYVAAPLEDGDRALMKTMSKVTETMATQEELQAAVDEAKPIPKGNFQAEEIHEVYVPEQIIGADVLAAVPVRDWQQTLRAGESVNVFSRFAANRMSRVAARDENLNHLRLLRYLYWMILYWQQARPGKERGTKRQPPRKVLKEKMDGAPDAIIESIRRVFSDNGTLRKYHQDLMMTHCAAFACIIDGFEMNTLDLREDLRLEQKQISQYLSEIGARVKLVKEGDKTIHLAKLMLPLKFPNSMRQRRQR